MVTFLNGKVIITPSLKVFLTTNFPSLCTCVLMGILTGTDIPLVKLSSFAISLCAGLYLLWQLWYYTTVKWKISNSQKKMMSGVFFHKVDYVELFRVNDYSEERNLLQQILGIKDIIIMSTDRSHPRLRIYGVPASFDLISIIKPLVQKCRKENHIYEIANH